MGTLGLRRGLGFGAEMTDAEYLDQARAACEQAEADAIEASKRAQAARELFQACCPHLRQKYRPETSGTHARTECLDCGLTDWSRAGTEALDRARWTGGAKYV